MLLELIEGPAGSGKSSVARELLEAGAIDVLSDVTMLWVALSGVTRGPDGKYPVRSDDDVALGVALYTQAVAVRRALEEGARVGVTTSRAGMVEKWRAVADAAGAAFSVRTVDPGEATVRARLAGPDGTLSVECEKAIARWYIR